MYTLFYVSNTAETLQNVAICETHAFMCLSQKACVVYNKDASMIS